MDPRHFGKGMGMDNDEGVIKLAHGGSIRCPAHPADCTYVRIVDAEGNEVLYWDWHEWRDDPRVVMGAIMGAAKLVAL